ncbi:PPE family protein [Mycobacterium sp. Dal123C01]|uniref:PPE family protein n=1 Tax=Mycobacterium sp. Dal123C01 TaxID=3457577 RepID=UPI00403EF29F
MAIDFAALPPEITSSLMYSGAGAGPLMAAAAAYANLAAEVSATASQWESIISLLTTEQWTGGGSAAAATAAQPIVSYLTETATTLEQASAQATASAAAYEAAFAATVPPPVIAINRSTEAALVATNVLGQNTPAIAALDAQYAAMWVQDATMMATYSAASTAASALTPVTPLATTIDPGAQSFAAADAVTPFADPITSLAAAALPFQSTGLLQSIDGFLGTPAVLNGINGAVNTAAWFVTNGITTGVSLGHTLAGAAVPAAAVSDVVPEAGSAGVVEGTVVRSVTPMAGMGYGGGATGSLGQATTVGKLSVPATWSSAAPVQAELAAATAPLEGSGWTVATEETGTAMGAPGMPGMVGGAKGAGSFGSGPRYGFKPIVMPKQVVV